MEVIGAPEKNRQVSDETSRLIFVSSPLNGDNYLVWSRAMKFALGSRMKLSFIDGRAVRPSEDSPNLDEWIRKDYLGDLSITEYYTKLRKLWDELACLDPLPVCTCTAHRGIVIREASHQMMQFLMGLSTPFANIRSQILVMDPRPDVVKAFAMLLNVEKELHVHTQFPENSKALAYKVEHKVEQNVNQPLFYMKTKPHMDKRSLFCNHCQRSGHVKETCFKLHGTPEWYKNLNDKRKKGGGRGRGAFTGNITDGSSQYLKNSEGNLSDILRSELKKLLHEDNASDERQRTPLDMVQIHFAEVEEFAAHTGSIQLAPDIVLDQVLYIPSFSVNLLSVSQLCACLPFSFEFTKTCCFLQDLRTRKRLAVGKLVGKLYILDSSSFSVIPHYLTLYLSQFLIQFLHNVMMSYGI
ncbi:UNVERIFIED_CONTAM: hypothetical protein Slati_0958900 [Sesamum latifolium]|uniref:Retrotransposon Copia-like N-terminal domain-containing protein n=1 Tax=Sesamum latifolium TaxID=2727402 RepID=A0AAW2XTG3_9LAMI